MSYVNHDFYEDLVESFADWQHDDRLIDDLALKEQCRSLLEREARLLDQARYQDWLGLYAPDCLYWVPATPGGGDPRKEVAVCFDDRRRIEDRVYRLNTGYAWSQAPASRTVRMLSNVEIFALKGKRLMARSNFLISEFRSGETRVLSGWSAHRLAQHGAKWLVEVKQVNLIDCDQNLRNPSIVF
jgi:3-phenylpropionate/cinnamic acid dioxygenase small subunit